MSFSRVSTLTTLALSAAAALALPAGTAAAKKAPKYPVITKVTPMQVGVGDLLTIKGKGFRSGKNKNTIVFKRFGQRAIFVKGESATTTRITLHVPLKLQAYMKVANNQPVPSVFAIRIIARRFGQRFTSKKLSPIVGPAGTGIATPGSTPPSAYEQCLGKADGTPAGDEDKDTLRNDLEKSVGTDPCRADTDTDGMSDGWEYQSALDLNSRAVPYPGKKPWPNALDPTDGVLDFDGDGLTSSQEFALWQYVGSPVNPDGTLGAYSDGTQNTGGSVPTAGNPSLQNLEIHIDGNLTDDERDADGDGLSNEIEWNNAGLQAWWTAVYKDEKPYVWRTFAELSAVDPDSDGDGVLDGADDQDVDGYDNFTEMQLNRERGALLVQPFNPCLPDPWSLTCGRYIPLDPATAWPPFDTSYAGHLGKAIPFTLSDANPAPGEPGWDGRGGPQGP
jgi:Bacterial TSP3 repeat